MYVCCMSGSGASCSLVHGCVPACCVPRAACLRVCVSACLRVCVSACLRGACCGVIGCIVNDLNDIYYDLV